MRSLISTHPAGQSQFLSLPYLWYGRNRDSLPAWNVCINRD